MSMKTDPTTKIETHETENTSQLEKFKEAARQLETDDDEKRFDERLKNLAKAPAKSSHDKKDDKT